MAQRMQTNSVLTYPTNYFSFKIRSNFEKVLIVAIKLPLTLTHLF